MKQSEWIYYTMRGEMEIPIAEVEDEFAEGKRCERLYSEIFDSNRNLCRRMGVEDDPDVERIIDNFFEMNRILCLKMYDYGVRDSTVRTK